MATRRKPKAFRDGGAVHAEPPIADTPAAERLVPEGTSEPAPEPPPAEDSDAVIRALMAQRQAEAMHAQAMQHHQQQPQPAPPQMSERRQRFIAEHPEILDPANQEAVFGYWRQGLRM